MPSVNPVYTTIKRWLPGRCIEYRREVVSRLIADTAARVFGSPAERAAPGDPEQGYKKGVFKRLWRGLIASLALVRCLCFGRELVCQPSGKPYNKWHSCDGQKDFHSESTGRVSVAGRPIHSTIASPKYTPRLSGGRGFIRGSFPLQSTPKRAPPNTLIHLEIDRAIKPRQSSVP